MAGRPCGTHLPAVARACAPDELPGRGKAEMQASSRWNAGDNSVGRWDGGTVGSWHSGRESKSSGLSIGASTRKIRASSATWSRPEAGNNVLLHRTVWMMAISCANSMDQDQTFRGSPFLSRRRRES